jgi:PPOX class probable F420-dependent enzyme
MRVDLPDRFVALLRGPNPCFITTLMPDGSPQTTETWVDTDGEHVIINTVQTHQKLRNIQREPRVSLAVCDAGEPSRYFAVRGRVTNVTTEGGRSTSSSWPSGTPAARTSGTAVEIRFG